MHTLEKPSAVLCAEQKAGVQLRLGTLDFRGSCGRQSLQPNIPNRQAEAVPEQEVLVWPIVSVALCSQPPVLAALLQLEAQRQLGLTAAKEKQRKALRWLFTYLLVSEASV